MYKIFPFLLLELFFIKAGSAQQDVSRADKAKSINSSSNELYYEIARVDSLLFNSFNTCDSLTNKKYFTDDLEFYHDLGGLTISAKNESASLREMCARGSKIRRELVRSSLEVYPIKNYGAIEIGVHRFYHTNKGEKEKLSGTYKFIHIWQKKADEWRISRVISYGHDEMKN